MAEDKSPLPARLRAAASLIVRHTKASSPARRARAPARCPNRGFDQRSAAARGSRVGSLSGLNQRWRKNADQRPGTRARRPDCRRVSRPLREPFRNCANSGESTLDAAGMPSGSASLRRPRHRKNRSADSLARPTVNVSGRGFYCGPGVGHRIRGCRGSWWLDADINASERVASAPGFVGAVVSQPAESSVSLQSSPIFRSSSRRAQPCCHSPAARSLLTGRPTHRRCCRAFSSREQILDRLGESSSGRPG
jgi:hypothetical protein